ncbi:unnamed protein product [marine sediment metagenome]|uniref:Uncharacterized protein n=1 Tax=marine sediment metagenome TaxID=412755 RepID=X1IJG4_9ZZZZ
MKPNITERDRALSLLEEQLPQLSKLFKECYLGKGRGAIVLHTFILEKNLEISEIAYNKKNESLDLFDNVSSRAELRKLIANYDPTFEGILILIIESGAAWFVTVKLHPPSEKGS